MRLYISRGPLSDKKENGLSVPLNTSHLKNSTGPSLWQGNIRWLGNKHRQYKGGALWHHFCIAKSTLNSQPPHEVVVVSLGINKTDVFILIPYDHYEYILKVSSQNIRYISQL